MRTETWRLTPAPAGMTSRIGGYGNSVANRTLAENGPAPGRIYQTSVVRRMDARARSTFKTEVGRPHTSFVPHRCCEVGHPVNS